MSDEYSIEALENDIAELVKDIKSRDAEIARLRSENERLRESIDMGQMDYKTMTDSYISLREEYNTVQAWARRAYVMLDCVEAEGNWNMFNLLEDAPAQVQEVDSE